MLKIIKKLLNLSDFKDGQRIKLGFLFGFLEALCRSFVFIAVFLMLKEIIRIKMIFTEMDVTIIFKCLLILILSTIGQFIFKYLLSIFQSGTGYNIFAKQRLEIGDMLKNVQMGYFDKNSLGNITSAVTTDMSFVEMYAMHLLDKIVNGYINVLLFSLLMLYFDWRIGSIFIFTVILSIVIYGYLQKKGKVLAPKRQAAQADLVSNVIEYIQGMSVIKAFHITDGATKKIHSAFEKSQIENYTMEKSLIPIVSMYNIIFKISSSIIVFLSCYFTLNNTMELSNMILILIASFTIYSALESLGGVTVMLRMMDASLDRIAKIKSVETLKESATQYEISNYDISVENINFSYGHTHVIKNVSFTVPENSTTAIVGPSGSGKTTICNLISRFWDVDSGSIKIGGRDIRDISYENLLKNISMVFQNVYLFNDSIINNILFGNINATYEEVVEVSKKACCHDFIMNLEMGYDTVVGEGGYNLSGGEKQRISIARAMLKDTPIVILDEATASIDPENEKDIERAIEALTHNKTKIVIAHKLSTVKKSSQIIVLKNGEISQIGSHRDLISQNGIYKTFLEIKEKATSWSLKKI